MPSVGPKVTSDAAEPHQDDAELINAVAALLASERIQVPPIPDVVARLSNELSSPNCDLREATKIVGTDQVLSAHILRCASSAQLAMRGPVTSLNEAVMRVGTNSLFSLTTSFCLAKQVTRKTPLESVRRELFRRAAASAEFCRLLAHGRAVDPEIGFLCGLLGTWGMMMTLAAIEQVLADQRVRPARPGRFWMQVAHDCDTRYGGILAKKWGLPQIVSDVLASRALAKMPEGVEPYVRLLGVADRLTAVFYREAEPSLEAIAEAAGVDVDEARPIAALMPQVAAAVWSLSASIDQIKMGAANPSAVTQVIDTSGTMLRGNLVPTSFPVIVDRGGSNQTLVCTGLAVDGLLARGDLAIPINQTVKCRLIGPGDELDLFAVVASKVRDGSGFLFELKPIGLTSMHAHRWQELRTRAASGDATRTDSADRMAITRGADELPPVLLEIEKVPLASHRRTQILHHVEDARAAERAAGAYRSVRRGLPIGWVLVIAIAAAALAAGAAFLLI